MSRLRFATARSLFQSFPESAAEFTVTPTDDSPIVFLQGLLAQEKFEDALTFCAYLLPRREAVWWGCGGVRTFLDGSLQSPATCLAAAEAWVHAPDDERRRAALEAGSAADSNDALTWLALAAGWSGGMLSTHPKAPVPVPPYMTPRALRTALLLSARFLKSADRTPAMQTCIADGMKLAHAGLA
jgi:hypothetical protein